MKIRKSKNKKKRGFTLNEMITSVAIIGVILGVAVPNFLRLRWEVDLEMVRQNLEVIHDTLNELLNDNGAFPDNLFNIPGDTEESVEIAASLSAIDVKGFEQTYRLTPSNGFLMVVQPQDATRRVGNVCFEVDALGVRRNACADPWDGSGVAMAGQSFWGVREFINQLFLDSTLTDDAVAAIMAGFLEKEAYNSVLVNPEFDAATTARIWEIFVEKSGIQNEASRLREWTPELEARFAALEEEYRGYVTEATLSQDGLREWNALGDVGLPSIFVSIYQTNQEKMIDLMPKIYERLDAQGVTVQLKEGGLSHTDWLQDNTRRRGLIDDYDRDFYLDAEEGENGQLGRQIPSFEFGFSVTDRPSNSFESNDRLLSSENYELFNAYQNHTTSIYTYETAAAYPNPCFGCATLQELQTRVSDAEADFRSLLGDAGLA
jgi:prepilin-type N-terminal cleavage/methylation domain-containing protein